MADECIKTANLPANMKLFVFDLAGTTVDDSIEGVPLVAIAMKEAFRKNGYKIDVSLVNKYRGMEKRDAIQSILNELHELNGSNNSSSNISVDGLFKDFKFSLNQNLSLIKNEIAGTTEVFQKLKSTGAKIAVGSGFPHSVVETITHTLNWSSLVDFVCSAEKAGHGRPHPAMIHSAMKFCGVKDPRSVVKVGDTKVDVEEGKNAGCWTISVLTGTQSREFIAESKPDFIINSIANLPDLLSNGAWHLSRMTVLNDMNNLKF